MVPEAEGAMEFHDELGHEAPGLSAGVGNQAGRQYVGRLEEAADLVRSRLVTIPDTLVILGSGLGGFADLVTPREIVSYGEIPHMPTTSTEGHAGNLLVGSVDGVEIAIFQGRVHCHDGLDTAEVAFGARVMTALGIKNLIVTNAAGSLNPEMRVGDLMIIKNHISTFLPQDPSFGLEHPRLGDKFYPQTDAYSAELQAAFAEIARSQGYGDRVHSGNYCFLPGPRYESRGDIEFLRALRVVDAVGMSTVPEVLAVTQMSHGTVKILGVSTITNQAAGLSETQPNHQEVKEAGAQAAPMLQAIVRELMGRL